MTSVASAARASSGQPRPDGAHLGHIHNFRGLAILFIVSTHVLSVFDWSTAPTLERVLKYLVANGTTFFLFISGYLFEYLSPRFEAAGYWRQKMRFVVLPYLIVSAPALWIFTKAMQREGMRADFYQQPPAMQVLEFIVTGRHLAPFWFIPTIVCFYLFAPLILRAFRRDAAFMLLPLLFLLPGWLSRSSNPLLNMLHFLPIWVMGMAICRFRETAEPRLQSGWLVLLSAAVLLGIAEFMLTRGTHTYLGYVQKSVLLLFLLSAIIWFGQRADSWLAWAGTLSFGIFFVHSYVISAGKMALQRVYGELPAGSLGGVAVAAVIAAAASGLLVQAFRRALGPRSRFVIGV